MIRPSFSVLVVVGITVGSESRVIALSIVVARFVVSAIITQIVFSIPVPISISTFILVLPVSILVSVSLMILVFSSLIGIVPTFIAIATVHIKELGIRHGVVQTICIQHAIAELRRIIIS